MLDVIGERLDDQPAPNPFVGTRKELVVDQFKPRLMALLDQAPTLADKVARGKRNKKARKLVAGMPIRLAHAGSATALEADPAGLAMVDEYDGHGRRCVGEGGVSAWSRVAGPRSRISPSASPAHQFQHHRRRAG